MKKTIRLILIITGVVITVTILALNYQSHFSKVAIKGKENLTLSKSLRVGMSDDEVLKIMGNPDTTIKNDNPIYCYVINDESFGYGQIMFDSTMKVIEIYFPK